LEEKEAILDLVRKGHQKAAAKIGIGVDKVVVKQHPIFETTRCFFLVRSDGTEEDFSYIKCIDSIAGSVISKRKRDEKVFFTPGQILRISGLSKEYGTKDKVKELFGDFSQHIKFVWMNNEEADVRFGSTDDASNARNAILKDCPFNISVLQGEEERKFWERANHSTTKKNQPRRGRNDKSKGNGRGRGRGKQNKQDKGKKRKIETPSNK